MGSILEREPGPAADLHERLTDWGDWCPWPSAEHVYAWDPVTVLRGLAEDRDILERHRPAESGYCAWCGYPTRWERCAEALSLARRHGMEVAGQQ